MQLLLQQTTPPSSQQALVKDPALKATAHRQQIPQQHQWVPKSKTQPAVINAPVEPKPEHLQQPDTCANQAPVDYVSLQAGQMYYVVAGNDGCTYFYYDNKPPSPD